MELAYIRASQIGIKSKSSKKMKIRRERPSQRLHHRVAAPVTVSLPEGDFETVDWSLGGFAVKGYPHQPELLSEMTGTFHIPFQGFAISFEFTATIARLGEEGLVAAKFIDLQDRETEILTHFIDELVRGSVTAFDDALLRIDSPVTPVSTEPDKNPIDQIPVRKWPIKAVLHTFFYLTLGVFVVGYSFLAAYSHFYRLEIEAAVISAPIEEIVATTDGKIANVPTQEGLLVPTNTSIIFMEDPKLEREIDLAKIDIRRKTMMALAKENELKAEISKIKDYKLIAESEVNRLNNRMDYLQDQVVRSRRQMYRIQELEDKGWSSKTQRDQVEAEYAKIKSDLEEVRAIMIERRALLSSLEEGRYFSGDRFEGNIIEKQTELDLALDHLTLAQDELNALVSHRARLDLGAPTNGRLLRLLKSEGSSVKKGETIALFERDEARLVHAYLTQEEIIEIGLGAPATIYFPSLDERTTAEVTQIDRTTGFLEEVNSRYNWRGQKDRSALVTLEFVKLSADEIRTKYNPGLPAIVIFERQNKDELKSRLIGSLEGELD